MKNDTKVTKGKYKKRMRDKQRKKTQRIYEIIKLSRKTEKSYKEIRTIIIKTENNINKEIHKRKLTTTMRSINKWENIK